MKTLIIIAHPDITESNSQQFLIESTQNLQGVTRHILENRAFIVKEEHQLLAEHERIIFQFPMYWYSAPAILKKWLDDVFTNQMMKGFLNGKELGLVVTMGQSEESFAAGRKEKFSLSEIFKPFEALANKCGMTYLPIFPVALFGYLTEDDKKKILIKYQQYVTKENKETFISEESWFIDRLRLLVEQKKGPEQMRLETVLEAMEENRDNLDELLYLVKEMRYEDD